MTPTPNIQIQDINDTPKHKMICLGNIQIQNINLYVWSKHLCQMIFPNIQIQDINDTPNIQIQDINDTPKHMFGVS